MTVMTVALHLNAALRALNAISDMTADWQVARGVYDNRLTALLKRMAGDTQALIDSVEPPLEGRIGPDTRLAEAVVRMSETTTDLAQYEIDLRQHQMEFTIGVLRAMRDFHAGVAGAARP